MLPPVVQCAGIVATFCAVMAALLPPVVQCAGSVATCCAVIVAVLPPVVQCAAKGRCCPGSSYTCLVVEKWQYDNSCELCQ